VELNHAGKWLWLNKLTARELVVLPTLLLLNGNSPTSKDQTIAITNASSTAAIAPINVLKIFTTSFVSQPTLACSVA